MRNLKIPKGLALFAVILLILFFAVNFAVRNLIPTDGLRGIIVNELSSVVGGEVNMEDLLIPYANRLVLKGVTLSFEGGITVSIPEVELGIDPFAFAFNRQNPVKALREVIIRRPDIGIYLAESDLRGGSGRKDLGSGLESLSKSVKDLQAVLRVRDGVVKIDGDEEILNQTLKDVDIDIYTAGWPEIIGEISFISGKDKIGDVKISGGIDLLKLSVIAKLSTKGSNVGYIASIAESMSFAEKISDPDLLGISSAEGRADIILEAVGPVTDPASMDYKAKADLKGLSFVYEGRLAAGIASPIEVRDTSGIVEYNRKSVEFHNLGTTIEGEELLLNGRVLLARDITFDLNIRSRKDVDLSNLSGIIALPEGLEKISGRLGFDMSIKGDFNEILPYGTVRFGDVALKATDLKEEIRGLGGRALFDGTMARLDNITALYGNSRIGIEGFVEGYDKGIGNVSSSLKIEVEGVNVAEFLDEKPVLSQISPDILSKYDLKGVASASINVRGSLKNPIVDLSLNMPNGSLNGNGFGKLSVKAGYNDYSLKVEEFSVGIFGGMIRGDGYANSDGSAWIGVVNGTFSDIEAGRLYGAVAYSLMDVKGVINGNVRASFEFDDTLSFDGLGEVGAHNVRIGKYEVDKAKALMKFDETGLNIDRLEAYKGRSMVVATGNAGFSGTLDIEVHSNDADVRDLLSQFITLDAEGSGNLNGIVRGTLSNPVFEGEFDLDSASFLGVELERIKAAFEMTKQKITIKDGTITHKRGAYGRGTTMVSGSVYFAESYPMDLHAVCTNVGSDDAMKAFGMDYPLSGSLNAILDISGTAEKPQYHAVVEADGFTAFGQVVDKIEGDVRYYDSFIYVDSARITIGKGNLEVKGTVSPKGDLKMDLSGRGIDIGDLTAIPDDLGAGSEDMRITGMILGNLENPTFDGEINAEGMRLLGEAVGNVKGRIFIKDKRLTISRLQVGMPSGNVTAAGNIDLFEPYRLTVSMDISGGEVGMLARMLGSDSERSFEGTYSGNLKVSGTITDPMAELFLKSDRLSIAKNRVESAVLRGSIQRSRINITDLKMEQKSGYLTAKGVIDLEGEAALDISSKGFDIFMFSSILGEDASIRGKVDMNGSLSGPTRDPLLKVATTISEGGFDDYSFDELKGELEYSKGVLSFNNISMRQADYNAYINGTLPVDSKMLSAIGLKVERGQDNKKIDLKIEVPKTNLSLLSLFVPGISEVRGELGLILNISGSLKKILLDGDGFIEKGGFRYEFIDGEVKDLEGKFVFSGDKMIIEGIACQIGEGNVTAKGDVAFEGLRPKRLDLAVNGTSVPISHPSISGNINADLGIKGDISTPMISGAIAMNRAVFTLEFPKGELTASGSMNPAFDLNISLGNNAKISRRELDLLLRGDIRIGGTLASPTASGLIEAKRGRFSSFGMNFKITEGTAEFFEHNGIEPLLDIQAETVIDGVEIQVALHGPASNLMVDLTSNPMMSREEILELFPIPGAIDKMLKGDVVDVFRDNFISIFDQELRSYLVSDISRLFRSTFNLDQFTLESDTNRRMILNIGKYVIDDLYLSYKRSFESDPLEIFEIEYRLSPNITLSGELDDEGNVEIGINTKIRF